jgi:hypothetical protein
MVTVTHQDGTSIDITDKQQMEKANITSNKGNFNNLLLLLSTTLHTIDYLDAKD